jgi:hypothetical protein
VTAANNRRTQPLTESEVQQRIGDVKRRIEVTTDPMARLAMAFDLLRSRLADRFSVSRTDTRALKVVAHATELLVQLAERVGGESSE